MTKTYDEILGATGLRVTQLSVLRELSRQNTVSLTDLANLLVLDQTTMTRSVANLEGLGLIERVQHHDSRVKLLKLTPSGKQKVRAADQCWEQAQSVILERITPEEWEVTAKTLRKLAAADF